jgi:hypothetical protein
MGLTGCAAATEGKLAPACLRGPGVMSWPQLFQFARALDRAPRWAERLTETNVADVEDLILEKLRRIEDTLGTHTERLRRVEAGQSANAKILNLLQQDARAIRAAVNDLAKVGVTSGEIEAMHTDLGRLQEDVRELQTRVNLLETS